MLGGGGAKKGLQWLVGNIPLTPHPPLAGSLHLQAVRHGQPDLDIPQASTLATVDVTSCASVRSGSREGKDPFDIGLFYFVGAFMSFHADSRMHRPGIEIRYAKDPSKLAQVTGKDSMNGMIKKRPCLHLERMALVLGPIWMILRAELLLRLPASHSTFWSSLRLHLRILELRCVDVDINSGRHSPLMLYLGSIGRLEDLALA